MWGHGEAPSIGSETQSRPLYVIIPYTSLLFCPPFFCPRWFRMSDYSSQFLTEEKFASPAHFCPVHKGPSFAIITSDDLLGNNFSHPVHFYPPIFPSHWFRLFSAEEIINDTSCCTPVFTHSFRFGSCSQSLVVCC